ncbi:uncharacterized protein FOBCDRAFT_126759 [Fusarium oxysporum Fo47]|uniref:uncharacterized protein n=1 Tax=Fusarium oxysporum Fo47 TaxID=660027 RepID=UPI002869B3CD|nr:uncharacterized protein FOBCDRAFT_126759 [Fusarium oxysporum Fo47]QKD50427.2 hypothetical protein FOBCDRAFT_126759 [Fusarium oxysporum Fo47]
MQVNLFKILAITAAFSTVESAPVETAEGQVTREQVNETHVNEAVVDDAVPQKGCVKEEAPHISTRERTLSYKLKTCYALCTGAIQINTARFNGRIILAVNPRTPVVD